MTRYRSTLAPLRPGPTATVDQRARLGAPAEPWFAVWLPQYEPIDGPNGQPHASYRDIRPLRLRPITWRPVLW